VLIEVKAFGLNRSELRTRQGLASGVTLLRVLGIEAAGVVAQCPGGEFPVGHQVATMMGGMGARSTGVTPSTPASSAPGGPAIVRRSNFFQTTDDIGSETRDRNGAEGPEDSGAGAAGPRHPVESVAKAAELLRLFGQHAELRLSDVGQTIGVAASTAHRLLTTLEASGMISQNTTTRCYEPGPELLRLARALTPSASRWSYARPFSPTWASVSVRRSACDPAAHGRGVRRVGGGADPPAGGLTSGRPYAGQLRLRREDLAGGAFRRGAPRPLSRRTSRDSDPAEHSHRTELLAELKQVRRRGWATNFGESEPDVSGVAVTVASRAGEVPYAIAVAAPRSRLAQSRVKAIVDELRKTADLLATACSAT